MPEYHADGVTPFHVCKYDSSTGKMTRDTRYGQDGKTWKIDEFDAQTGKRVKELQYHADGKNLSMVSECNGDKIMKGVVYYNNGNVQCTFDVVKGESIGYTMDGKIKQISKFEPEPYGIPTYRREKILERTHYFDDGKVSCSVKYNYETGKETKTFFKKDGKTPLAEFEKGVEEYEPAKGTLFETDGKTELFFNKGNVSKSVTYKNDGRKVVTEFDPADSKLSTKNVYDKDGNIECVIKKDYNLISEELEAKVLSKDGQVTDIINPENFGSNKYMDLSDKERDIYKSLSRQYDA